MGLGRLMGGAAQGWQMAHEMQLQDKREKRTQEEYDRAKRDRDEREAIARAQAGMGGGEGTPEGGGPPAADVAAPSAVAMPRAEVTPLAEAPKVYDQGAGTPSGAGLMDSAPSLTKMPDVTPMPGVAKAPRLASETTIQGAAPISVPGTPSAADPGAAPMVSGAPAVARQKTPTSPGEYDRLLSQWDASQKKALELNRPDIAIEYALKGMPIREKLRGQAFDRARTVYDSTGDVKAFIEPFNKYVNNGISIEDMVQNPDGTVTIKSRTAEGKEGSRIVKPDEFRSMVRMATDPAAARALEAQYLHELDKNRLKMSEINAERRFQKVSAGETLVDTANGSTFRGEATPEVKPVVVPGSDGSGSSVIWYDPRKGPVGTSGSGAGGGQEGVRPKPVAALQSDAQQAIYKNLGASQFSSLDPKSQVVARERTVIADQIVSGAYGTKGFESLGAGTVEAMAAAVQSGKIKPQPGTLGDRKVEYIEWQGQKYILGPVQRPAMVASGGAIPDGGGPSKPTSTEVRMKNGMDLGSIPPEGPRQAQWNIQNLQQEIAGWKKRGGKEAAGIIAGLEEEIRKNQIVISQAQAIPRQPVATRPPVGLGTRSVQGEVTR